ncbi:PREDICTED: uncharacterized protein LOC105448757 isoform X2 [Wasmannia auropunctata]|uniref:uncharacterized protein LOC105448757 isoform X2 n=1 Tax=Wasmannia auropunctata TaxID=64793 RepID=UPI0005ED8DCC|nr:PREDICTED: uncharacterized protein LOC105448757 isoform X2 [Wasmannia auropunctata]
MDIMQEKGQSFKEFSEIQEIDIPFPIFTIRDLTTFEEQLKEKKFQDDVLHFLKRVGGGTASITIRNIFKTAISDNLAKEFSWAGRKNKESFKDLKLSKIIIHTKNVKGGRRNCL